MTECTNEMMQGTWYVKFTLEPKPSLLPQIDPDDLLPDTKAETKLHCTLAKLCPSQKLQLYDRPEPHVSVVAAAKQLHAFKVNIGAVDYFANDGVDVLYMTLDCKGALTDAHEALQGAIAKAPGGATWPHERFQPHLTLAMLKPGKGAKYKGKSHALQATFITELVFAKFKDKTVPLVVVKLK